MTFYVRTTREFNGKMNTVRLAPFFNVAINNIDSNGYYAISVRKGETQAIVAIENVDRGDDVNNFGMIKLHDFSNIKLSNIKFDKFENDTACHVPSLNSVCVNLDASTQIWIYSDESEYIEDDVNEVRVVQIVQNDNVQQYYL